MNSSTNIAAGQSGNSSAEAGLAAADNNHNVDNAPSVAGEHDYLRAAADQVRGNFDQDTAVEVIQISDHRLQPALMQLWLDQPICSAFVTAVDCGLKSKGLCALIVKDRNAVDQFIQLNPSLADTLVMSWSKLFCVWLRLSGWCPENIMSCDGSYWISSGLMPIINIFSTSQPSTPSVDKVNIAAIKFADVRWPNEFEEKFYLAYTHALYGPFFQALGPKKRVLNFAAVARIFTRALGLVFDVNTQTFRRQKSKGQPFESITTAHVINLVTQCLETLAAQNPRGFPLQELQVPRIKLLVESIKTVSAYFRTDASQSLIEYVRSRLCVNPGRDLTVAEVHADYLTFVRQRNMGLLPQTKFFRELPRMVLDQFAIARVNNVPRVAEGKSQPTARRGFHGLALKSDAADVRDASDGPDGVVGKSN